MASINLSPLAAPITSLQNPRVKQVVRLANRRRRDEAQQTVVEGMREIARALEAGVVPVEAFICTELLDDTERTTERVTTKLKRLAAERKTALYEVTAAVFEKMVYRGASGGVLLVVPYRPTALAELPISENPFLVVVVGAEKPGNLGAILRTADAAGVDGVIVVEERRESREWDNDRQLGGTDVHNPNTIRASLGAYFTVPLAMGDMEAVMAWLGAQRIVTVATTPTAETRYTEVDMTGPTAVVMGSEASGLSEAWLAAADRLACIPMFGVIDSMNLSAATALLLYEVVRQRT